LVASGVRVLHREEFLSNIRATRDSARGIESRTINDFARGRAKKVAAKAKAREARLERMLSDEHRKEKPRGLERIRLATHHLTLADRLRSTWAR